MKDENKDGMKVTKLPKITVFGVHQHQSRKLEPWKTFIPNANVE